MTDDATVRADDRDHVFHSWSAQGSFDPLPIAGALGSYFWDYSGKRYLDFSSQLVNVNIGHQHPRLVAAIQEQAATLCTVSPAFANDKRGEAARLIAELAPGTLNKVFFTNGGAEANENAIRMARVHTGRHKVLATYRSYHGSTAAAMTATGEPRRWANEPTAVGVVHFWGPYPYRSAFHSTVAGAGDRAGAGPPARHDRLRGRRRRSRRCCWRPWSAPTASWSRRRGTSPASGTSVTSTGSCSSPTR